MRILKKTRSAAASDTSDKGFVCLYFLVLFLLCTAVITVLMNSLQDRLRTAMNIRKADELLAQEAAVLSFVKCELRNERLADGTYQESGVRFSITMHDGRIDAVIRFPRPEILQITLEDDTRVYDYDVIRSEQPA